VPACTQRGLLALGQQRQDFSPIARERLRKSIASSALKYAAYNCQGSQSLSAAWMPWAVIRVVTESSRMHFGISPMRCEPRTFGTPQGRSAHIEAHLRGKRDFDVSSATPRGNCTFITEPMHVRVMSETSISRCSVKRAMSCSTLYGSSTISGGGVTRFGRFPPW
jgi:hypothetical protein